MLCPLVLSNIVSAQIYSTAEAALRTTRHQGGGSIMSAPPSISFRSTSSYSAGQSGAPSFSTTTVHFANGSIKTAASSLTGGMLADDTGFTSTYDGNNQTTTSNWNENEDGWGTGTPDLPLHLDWDALLFILFLAGGYALYLRRKLRTAPL